MKYRKVTRKKCPEHTSAEIYHHHPCVLCTACQKTVLKTNVRSRAWVGKISYTYVSHIILENRLANMVYTFFFCLLYALIDWLFYGPREFHTTTNLSLAIYSHNIYTHRIFHFMAPCAINRINVIISYQLIYEFLNAIINYTNLFTH